MGVGGGNVLGGNNLDLNSAYTIYICDGKI